ncbi:membrane-associated protein, putative, partial [Bodo saltans]
MWFLTYTRESKGIYVMATRGVDFGGFVLLVAFLGVFNSATTLDCTDAANLAAPNITITAAGDYDVTCVGSSTWFLFVDGCGNVGSTFVTLQLRSSPKQVILSDIGNPSTSLRGCRVNITYFASTTAPAAGATSARDAHVVVETSSPVGAVVVTVLGAMHLEGKFMSIEGNGTGSIDLVDISFPSGSTIECRSAYPACSTILGTAVLGLGLGCPTIGKVRIVLNGTNTSTSMVSSTMPTASFALIIIDNSTGLSTAPTPRDHEIVVDRVGILLPETSLLHLRQAVGITTVANPYPFFNGTIIVRGVSITTTSASNSPLFNLDNPTVATLMFDGVDSVVGIVSISQGFNQKSVVCGSVHILLDNCDINSTFDSAVVVPLAREIATLDCALALDVQAHNVTFSPRNHRTLVSVSNPPLLLLTISIKLTVRACKIVLQDASYQVLAIVANTTAVNSMIQLINTEIVLQWTPYVESNFNFSSRTVYFTEIAPVSI